MTPDLTLRPTVLDRIKPSCEELIRRGLYLCCYAEWAGGRLKVTGILRAIGGKGDGAEFVTWVRPRHFRRGDAHVRLLRRALR